MKRQIKLFDINLKVFHDNKKVIFCLHIVYRLLSKVNGHGLVWNKIYIMPCPPYVHITVSL